MVDVPIALLLCSGTFALCAWKRLAGVTLICIIGALWVAAMFFGSRLIYAYPGELEIAPATLVVHHFPYIALAIVAGFLGMGVAYAVEFIVRQFIKLVISATTMGVGMAMFFGEWVVALGLIATIGALMVMRRYL